MKWEEGCWPAYVICLVCFAKKKKKKYCFEDFDPVTIKFANDPLAKILEQ